jgi:hypothetical protein
MGRVPSTIKRLFIAESPPGDERTFFYYSYTGNFLRERLVGFLGIRAVGGEEGLREFQERGYFLVDAVECRVKRTCETAIPLLEVINNCSNLLSAKIELARTRGAKKIVILGSTAIQALKELGFNELREKSVAKNCGEAVESRGFKIFILPLPARRGTKCVEQCYTDKVIDRLRRFVEAGQSFTQCNRIMSSKDYEYTLDLQLRQAFSASPLASRFL